MANLSTPDAGAQPRARLEMVCPADGGPLHWDDAGITCRRCARAWERSGDLWAGAPARAVRGEAAVRSGIPEEKAALLPEEAERLGWEDALRNYLGEARFRLATDPARADGRFLVPLDEGSRVLDLDAGWGTFSVATAPEVGVVVARGEGIPRARFLEIRARQLGHDNVIPLASPIARIPFPDTTFDLAVLGESFARAGRGRTHRDARLRLLRAVRSKLRPGGRLLLDLPGDGPLPSRAVAGLGGREARKLLGKAGFAGVRVFTAIPGGRNSRALVPAGDPIPFDFWCALHPGDPWAGKVRTRLARAAFRAGLPLPGSPGSVVVARRGGQRS